MDEQQKRVVALLKKMVFDKKQKHHQTLRAIEDTTAHVTALRDKHIADSAAIEALTNEIAKWERT